MSLYAVPLICSLAGLTLYAVLAGADFGAGVWLLAAGRGAPAAELRDHAHNATAPVWEANHVWLIFVLTVVWTAYPVAFGSIASTLSVPLFLAGIGIVLRGAAYALRAGTVSARERRIIDSVSGVSSLLTPFALGAAVGAIASRRVPVGNAAGGMFASWLNPTSILVGVLAVATAALLAAVFLAADAVRLDQPALALAFRTRALAAGLVAGALAIGGLIVLRGDAQALYRGLVSGGGLAAVLGSAAGGVATLGLVWRRRFEPARYTAAAAVAAIVGGWALAQRPTFLPGLTIQQAAAGHDTLVAVTAAIAAGGVVLGPSLVLLFRLTLGGRLGHGAGARAPEAGRGTPPGTGAVRLRTRLAAGALVVGVVLTNGADAAWAHAVGVASLVGFVGLGLLALLPASLPGPAENDDGTDAGAT